MNKINKYVFAFLLAGLAAAGQMTAISAQSVQVESVKMITGPEKNHYFGYYGMNVWNAEKTHVLALEADLNDRLPQPGEEAVIGLVEIATGRFTPITRTRAWNLQQGCMLTWNPLKPSEEFYYNDIVDDRLVSVKYNLRSGKRTVIPYTISGISNDGRYALYMNYGRISRLRKVVSYSGTTDPNPTVAHPENDGVFIVDLKSGKARLLVSYAQMARDIATYCPEIEGRHMWTEHAVFSKTGSRILFLPRTWDGTGEKLETGLYTIAFDGSDMRKVLPYGASVSHFGWRNDHEIVVTYNYDGRSRQHVLVNDRGEPFRPIADLKWDGHCSFDRTGDWILSDGSKDSKDMTNTVWMHHLPSGTTHKIHTLEMVEKRYLGGDTRCDLHPRISNDNSMVCVDAIDPQTARRQMFIIGLKLDPGACPTGNLKSKK